MSFKPCSACHSLQATQIVSHSFANAANSEGRTHHFWLLLFVDLGYSKSLIIGDLCFETQDITPILTVTLRVLAAMLWKLPKSNDHIPSVAQLLLITYPGTPHSNQEFGDLPCPRSGNPDLIGSGSTMSPTLLPCSLRNKRFPLASRSLASGEPSCAFGSCQGP